MAHTHDLIDFTTVVYIVHENRVLLVFHKQLKKWLPVGGHIELDEDPDQALFREVKEECGLDIEVLSNRPTIESKGTKFLYSPSFMDIHDISETHQHVGLVYFAKAKSDKYIHNKDEHEEIKWFTQEDLSVPKYGILPAVKFYAQKALARTLFGLRGP